MHVEGWARWSRCRRYRTALGRRWSEQGGRVAFVALNPSTADADHDDPTLRRCRGFAVREGAGELVVVNLFGLRATHPRDLWASAEPVGPSTDRVLREVLPGCDRVVVCWGALPGRAVPRARSVLRRLDAWGATVCHLGTTRGGHPRHPLYLPRDAPLQAWTREQRGGGPYAP